MATVVIGKQDVVFGNGLRQRPRDSDRLEKFAGLDFSSRSHNHHGARFSIAALRVEDFRQDDSPLLWLGSIASLIG